MLKTLYGLKTLQKDYVRLSRLQTVLKRNGYTTCILRNMSYLLLTYKLTVGHYCFKDLQKKVLK